MPVDAVEAVEEVYRSDWGRIVAALIGLVGVLVVRAVFKVALYAPEEASAVGDIDTGLLCLAAAGATFADVCKVTVYLKNVADREKVNSVRKEYFGASRPASTLIEISQFVRPDLLIEVEAVGAVPIAASKTNA